jgi:uncharacterized protein YdiU (UPF0061 family)
MADQLLSAIQSYRQKQKAVEDESLFNAIREYRMRGVEPSVREDVSRMEELKQVPRAINLGELSVKSGIQTLQLKGAGPTPYSRTADGLAVLRSSVREFLCSEAMFHLGVPTTRALSLALTGEEVLRDMLYNGNAQYEKGAVVCRVAPSFIRFGSFEFFAWRQNTENLKKLADFTMEHYFSHLDGHEQKYLKFFEEVATKTCEMIIHWQRVGFVHGVMNTDNMSIHGLTIDYGPYGWMDNYDPDWTPNTTDLPGKRYRFANQPVIAQWNLLKLANALYPIILEENGLKDIIENFQTCYKKGYLSMMIQKLGLKASQPSDEALISELTKTMKDTQSDMTIFFRLLSNVNDNMTPSEAFEVISKSLYSNLNDEEIKIVWQRWFLKYLDRLKDETISNEERKVIMDKANPKYVLRNYMAQIAIEAADKGDFSVINELYQVLKQPYVDQPEYQHWFEKRPDWAIKKVGCSMLSCSS